jgi:hypothetical protein
MSMNISRLQQTANDILIHRGVTNILVRVAPLVYRTIAAAAGVTFSLRPAAENSIVLCLRGLGYWPANLSVMSNCSRIRGDVAFSGSPNRCRYARYESVAAAHSGIQKMYSDLF